MNNPSQHTERAARIMVVDDEESITLFLLALLGNHGYQVTAFNDPATALDHFEAAPDEIDLIISDQTMPGMTGTEMAARIFARRPALPFLLCTGYSDGVDKLRAQTLGLGGFLHKPYKSSELLTIIKTLLSKPVESSAPLHTQ